jgi:hypothetical protein
MWNTKRRAYAIILPSGLIILCPSSLQTFLQHLLRPLPQNHLLLPDLSLFERDAPPTTDPDEQACPPNQRTF